MGSCPLCGSSVSPLASALVPVPDHVLSWDGWQSSALPHLLGSYAPVPLALPMALEHLTPSLSKGQPPVTLTCDGIWDLMFCAS